MDEGQPGLEGCGGEKQKNAFDCSVDDPQMVTQFPNLDVDQSNFHKSPEK